MAQAAVERLGEDAKSAKHGHDGVRGLVLSALGVVFGDIGTSPLYTLREAFGEAGGLVLSEGAVLGVLSLIFWSLILIVTIKYVVLILRADNRGEGGVLALGALASRAAADKPRLQRAILILSLAGLALFYGDGLITPAISVLSAVEGLETAAPVLEPVVLPVAIGVLLGLFVLQSGGTARMGRLFGPIMLAWFATLAVLGLAQIVQNPGVLRALDPRWGIGLFHIAGFQAFIAMGAIVLAVTGAEALYADMGHFGRPPIQLAWLGLVLPALVLNYFGQGALLLHDASALEHPFYHLAPDFLLYPLIGLATLAAIIASQAVISGVFSLTRQAVQLGHLPRMTIRHTSATEIGQIYIPRMNWLLAAGIIALVLGFQSSGALASAYGISVTGAMAIDAILAGIVAASVWGWGWLAVLVFGGLLFCDLGYFAANALKIPSGGWFPLLVAAALGFIIAVWRRGRRLLWQRLYADALSIKSFINHIDSRLIRVPGTAIFMTGDVEVVPNALLHNIKHNKVLHEQVILMRVSTVDVPFLRSAERVTVTELSHGFYAVEARYGFLQRPNVPRALEHCAAKGLPVGAMTASFFIGRETLVATVHPELGSLQERLFILLSLTALSATAYFEIPPGRVVELGTQVEI